MANYHLSAKVIGRGSPRTRRLPQSAVGAAAYGSASRLVEARTGVVYNFRRKPSVIGAGILTPEDAPVWANDREALWNRAERRERRKDAVVCREIEFSLARELAWPQRERLVRKFLDEQFVRRGMVADYALHDPLARDGRRQPHCHTLLTMRAFSGEEFGDKVRAWNSRALLRLWRAEWSKAADAALHEIGFSDAATLDHRSYRDVVSKSCRPSMKAGAATATGDASTGLSTSGTPSKRRPTRSMVRSFVSSRPAQRSCPVGRLQRTACPIGQVDARRRRTDEPSSR